MENLSGGQRINRSRSPTSNNNDENSFESFVQRKSKVLQDDNNIDELEINKYLQSPIKGLKEDPILYWEKNKHLYPRLYKVNTMEKFIARVFCNKLTYCYNFSSQ